MPAVVMLEYKSGPTNVATPVPDDHSDKTCLQKLNLQLAYAYLQKTHIQNTSLQLNMYLVLPHIYPTAY